MLRMAIFQRSARLQRRAGCKIPPDINGGPDAVQRQSDCGTIFAANSDDAFSPSSSAACWWEGQIRASLTSLRPCVCVLSRTGWTSGTPATYGPKPIPPVPAYRSWPVYIPQSGCVIITLETVKAWCREVWCCWLAFGLSVPAPGNKPLDAATGGRAAGATSLSSRQPRVDPSRTLLTPPASTRCTDHRKQYWSH
jgi:hypothetical protein